MEVEPIRKIADMKKCIQMFNDESDYIISVTKSKLRPGWLFVEKDGLANFWLEGHQEVNRQDQKHNYYYLTGSIFVTTSDFLKKQVDLFIGGRMKMFVIDEKNALDIDTKLDFEICKFVMESL